MSIHRWSEEVILVNLPGGSEKQDELQTVMGMVRDNRDCFWQLCTSAFAT